VAINSQEQLQQSPGRGHILARQRDRSLFVRRLILEHKPVLIAGVPLA